MTSEADPNTIAIDTNVFMHLLDKDENTNAHINSLLGALIQRQYKLLIDAGNKINGEYWSNVAPLLSRLSESSNERYLLGYFVRQEAKLPVTVEESDDLMRAIEGVVEGPGDTIDRTFVYVALHEGKKLVSNDHSDIVEGPPEEVVELGERRYRLLEATQNLRPDGAAILTSVEAADRFGH